VVSFTPLPLYPPGIESPYLLYRRLGRPQSRSGRRGEEKNLPLPGIEPGLSSSLPVAIPTELSPKKEDVIGRWRNLRNEELHNQSSSLSNKTKEIRRMGHIAHEQQVRNEYRIIPCLRRQVNNIMLENVRII
jgi:hypothetical protein